MYVVHKCQCLRYVMMHPPQTVTDEPGLIHNGVGTSWQTLISLYDGTIFSNVYKKYVFTKYLYWNWCSFYKEYLNKIYSANGWINRIPCAYETEISISCQCVVICSEAVGRTTYHYTLTGYGDLSFIRTWYSIYPSISRVYFMQVFFIKAVSIPVQIFRKKIFYKHWKK